MILLSIFSSGDYPDISTVCNTQRLRAACNSKNIVDWTELIGMTPGNRGKGGRASIVDTIG